MWVFACAYVSYLSLITKKYDSQIKNKKKLIIHTLFINLMIFIVKNT